MKSSMLMSVIAAGIGSMNHASMLPTPGSSLGRKNLSSQPKETDPKKKRKRKQQRSSRKLNRRNR
jgi:hypothetical protein